jgi:hypothetical protein
MGRGFGRDLSWSLRGRVHVGRAQAATERCAARSASATEHVSGRGRQTARDKPIPCGEDGIERRDRVNRLAAPRAGRTRGDDDRLGECDPRASGASEAVASLHSITRSLSQGTNCAAGSRTARRPLACETRTFAATFIKRGKFSLSKIIAARRCCELIRVRRALHASVTLLV